MNEFLDAYYTLITHLVEFIAALVGVCCYAKYKGTVVELLIFFLVYTCIIDGIAIYPSVFYDLGVWRQLKGTFLYSNHWWYTIFWGIGSSMFYTMYYYKIVSNTMLKLIIKYTAIVFLLFSIISIVTDIEYFKINTFRSIKAFSSFIVLLCVCSYFIEILNSDRILKFYKSFNFYFSVIVLLWWLIITPTVFYDQFYNRLDPEFMNFRRLIFLGLNCFMYLSLSIALICCKPKNI